MQPSVGWMASDVLHWIGAGVKENTTCLLSAAHCHLFTVPVFSLFPSLATQPRMSSKTQRWLLRCLFFLYFVARQRLDSRSVSDRNAANAGPNRDTGPVYERQSLTSRNLINGAPTRRAP